MSRCFPFPPPGYEKKAHLGDVDLLTKEIHREKKHKKDKKDKKDKEKREDKERKRDKERSEKHKEKKDRKEKHKHRDKDKDKDKEKKTVDEKYTVTQFEGQNGGKTNSSHLQNGEIADFNFLQELGKRIRDEDGARENKVLWSTDHRTTNLRGSIMESNVGNSTEGKEKQKIKREESANVNGQRNKVEQKGMENPFRHDFCRMGQKMEVAGTVDKDVKKQSENSFLHDPCGIEQKRVDVARPMDKDVTKPSENSFLHDLHGMEQNRVEVAAPVDKDVKKHKREKEKHKHKSNTDNRGDGQKDRDGEKKSKSKDKDRTKEKEKWEKQANKEQLRLGESGKDSIGVSNIKPTDTLNNKGSLHEGKPGKRKEPEMNGLLHDDDIRPNKMPRPMPSSHQLVENGKTLEPSQTSLQVACERQSAAGTHRVEGKVSSCQQILQYGKKLEPNLGTIQSASDMHGTANNNRMNKEGRINGLTKVEPLTDYCSNKLLSTSIEAKDRIEAKKPLSTSVEAKDKIEVKKPLSGSIQAKERVEAKKPSFTSTQAKEKVEPPPKPPHPDLKYLNQILSVPELVEWCDFDDQQWLFGCNNLNEEKPKMGNFEVDGTPRVWAEALRMESADVTALPYVVPF